MQEVQGNDVLYVWTHLNLRGDQADSIALHNMTYSLGKPPHHDRTSQQSLIMFGLSCPSFCSECFIINFNSAPDNLEEDSKYEARVEARNMFGWSNQSDVFKFFTRTKGRKRSLEVGFIT